jgi:hypothetical protein
MLRQEIICEIKKVSRFVQVAESEMNRLGIYPRTPWMYPFDIVGLATVSKAIAVSKACLKLLNSGFPDEAYGLSRSIVECANNLRYMTADRDDLYDSRVRNYVRQHLADKAYWAHYCLELFAGRPEEKEIRDYMDAEGIVADTKPASRHWSGERGFVWDTMTIDHPLDGTVTTKHKKISYAADYFQTSTFVHCSLPAVDNYAVGEATPFQVSTSTSLHETTQSTLFIIFLYLHSTIAYALFGMNMDRPSKLQAIFQKTQDSLKPIERRYSKIKHSP